MLAIILGADSTQLSTFTGDSNTHPIYLTLGNIPRNIRQKDHSNAIVPVAMMPAMPDAGKQDSGTKARYRDARKKLYHDVFTKIMEPLMNEAERYIDVVLTNLAAHRRLH